MILYAVIDTNVVIAALLSKKVGYRHGQSH